VRARRNQGRCARAVNGMTPAQYRDAIKLLGLSQVGAGRFLGVDPRTSRAWASGQSPIPVAVAKLLTLMIRWQIKPD
jgi:DNA-binding transcriptional regulator YiaG